MATKKYLAKKDRPKSIKAYQNHQLVARNEALEDWENFIGSDLPKLQQTVTKPIIIRNPIAKLQAVVSDIGIALLPNYCLRYYKNLVSCPLKYNPRIVRVDVAFFKTEYLPKKCRLFIDELKKYLTGF